MNQKLNRNNIVITNELFERYCTSEQKDFLNKQATYNFYKRSQIIFYENKPANAIYFVCSGKIAIWKKGVYKQKQIIRFAKDGDMFGYRGVITGKSTYYLSAITLDDSQVCSIENEVFKKILEKNPVLNFNMILFYIRELEKVETRLRNLVEMNVREKIADSLLNIQDIFGTNENNILNVPLSRDDIADYAGTSTDRVIKQLSEFQKDNILKTSGSKITLLKPEILKNIVRRFHK